MIASFAGGCLAIVGTVAFLIATGTTGALIVLAVLVGMALVLIAGEYL